MAAQVGDQIQLRAKTKRLAPAARVGTIEEVLDPDQPRYLVRWDDGRTSIVAPLADAFFITPREKAAKAKRVTDEPTGAITPTRAKLRSAPKRTKIPRH